WWCRRRCRRCRWRSLRPWSTRQAMNQGIGKGQSDRSDRQGRTMNTFMNWIRSGAALVAIAAIAVVLATQAAFAIDKVTLKNGEVYEGTITRETDSAIWMKRKVGTVEFDAFVLKEDVESIERDAETPSDPAKP